MSLLKVPLQMFVKTFLPILSPKHVSSSLSFSITYMTIACVYAYANSIQKIKAKTTQKFCRTEQGNISTYRCKLKKNKEIQQTLRFAVS